MRIIITLRWVIVTALLTLLILPATLATIAGIKLVTVDGKSMTPTYRFGDIVLVGAPTPADFAPGHVVTIRRPDGALYTHRIISITDGQAQLKGDGNAVQDPDTVRYRDVAGAVRGHITQPLASVLTYSETLPARISLGIVTIAFILLPLERPARQNAEGHEEHNVDEDAELHNLDEDDEDDWNDCDHALDVFTNVDRPARGRHS